MKDPPELFPQHIVEMFKGLNVEPRFLDDEEPTEEEVLHAIQDAQTTEEKQDAIRAYNRLRKILPRLRRYKHDRHKPPNAV